VALSRFQTATPKLGLWRDNSRFSEGGKPFIGGVFEHHCHRSRIPTLLASSRLDTLLAKTTAYFTDGYSLAADPFKHPANNSRFFQPESVAVFA
jgi:hypothetical protein